MIEILTTGAANTVQDLGRFGYLDAGVGRSGAMDGPALEIANSMLGNVPDCAGLELGLFPFRLRFLEDRLFAVTGADCPIRLDGRELPSWWTAHARQGDVLEIGPPRSGARICLAFAGGVDVPVVLGSRSTDLKSGWGGLDGRGLRRGDRLALGASPARLRDLPAGFGLDPAALGLAPTRTGGIATIRVLPSAEFGAFTDEAIENFFATDWRVGEEANRQGYRLVGPELALRRPLSLFSHGIVPGTVQVPPSGQPIIQLAEANSCGGYPKIANVVEADLWRLAQASAGSRIRFVETSRKDAMEAVRLQREAIKRGAAYAALARKDAGAAVDLKGLATTPIEQHNTEEESA